MGPNHLQTIAEARIPSFDPRQTCVEHQLGSPDLWPPSNRLALSETLSRRTLSAAARPAGETILTLLAGAAIKVISRAWFTVRPPWRWYPATYKGRRTHRH